MSNGQGHKVKVAVRARPLNQREQNEDAKMNWKIGTKTIQAIDPETHKLNPKGLYHFDNVFGPEVATSEIYRDIVAPIVEEAFKGFNGTVLCYGQTSSGKTHTLYGAENDRGIIDLLAEDIMSKMKADPSRQYVIKVNLIEIYNEIVKDLLNSENPVEIVEIDKAVVPRDIEDITVLCAEDISKAAQRLQRQRKIGETKMNSQSSRSHTIIRITIQIISQTVEEDNFDTSTEQSEDGMISAVLNFVDLAGSEKASQSGAAGCRLKEASHINTSLSALSKVVMQLSDKWESESKRLNVSTIHQSLMKSRPKSQLPFVSYRDSKLTRLLQSSLDGDALVAIICNITPASLDETASTLRFATSAKKIQTKPKQHIIAPSDKSKYENKIQELQYQLFGKNTELAALRETLLRFKGDSDISISGFEHRRMTICPRSGVNDDFQPGSIPTSRRSVGAFGGSIPEPIGAMEALKQFREAKVPYPTKKSVKTKSQALVSSILSTDKEAQTDFKDVDEVPSKRRRLTNTDESATPVSVVRMHRAMLSATMDEDRQTFKAEKEFRDAEIRVLEEEVNELKLQIALNETALQEKSKLSEELDLLKSSQSGYFKKIDEEKQKLVEELNLLKLKHSQEIELLKDSKEFEVDTLNAQIQKKNTSIKDLQSQLKGQSEDELGLDPNYIKSIQDDLQTFKSQISSLKEALQQRDTQKLENEEVIRLLKEEVSQQLTSKDEQEEANLKYITTLKESMDAEIRLLEEEVNNLKPQIALNEKALQEKSERLDLLNKDIEKEKQKLAEEINLLQTKHSEEIGSLKNIIEQRDTQKLEKEEEIRLLKEEFSQQLNAVVEQEQANLKHIDTLKESRAAEIKVLEEEINKLQIQITLNENVLQEKLKLSEELDLLKSNQSGYSKDIEKEKQKLAEEIDLLQTKHSEEIGSLKNIIEQRDTQKLEKEEEIRLLKELFSQQLNAVVEQEQANLKHIDTLKESRAAEIKVLQEEINKLQIQITLNENVLQEKLKLSEELDLLKSSQSGYSKEIEQEKHKLTEELTLLQTKHSEEIRSLKEALQQRDTQKLEKEEEIRLLKEEFSQQLNAVVEQEQANLKHIDTLKESRAAEIKVLEEEINKLKTQINLNESVLREKSKLSEELDLLKSSQSGCSKEIEQEKQKQIEELHHLNSKYSEKISSLEEILQQRDTQTLENEEVIRQLKEQLNLKISNLEEQDQAHLKYISTLKESMDAEINVLEEEVNKLKPQIALNEKALREKSEQLDLLKSGYSKEIEQEKQKLAGELNLLQTKHSEEIRSLKSIIQQRDTQKLEKEEEIRQLKEQLNSKEQQGPTNLKYTEGLKDNLKACWKENATLGDQIKEFKKSLEVKEAELNSLTNELHEVKSGRVVKPAVLESLYAELEELRQCTDKQKIELDKTLERLCQTVDQNKALTQDVEKLKNVKRPTRVNRGNQTPEEWNLQKVNNELKVRLKRANYLVEKADEKTANLTSDNKRSVSKLQEQLTEKTNRVVTLESYICKIREEKSTVKERQVEVGVQCQYIEELLARSQEGEPGLLPPEFPDVGQLLQDKKTLTNQTYLLEVALRKCQCNKEKNNRLLKLQPSPTPHQRSLESKDAQTEKKTSKSFVPRMGSASDRKLPEWHRSVSSTKTPSPSIFPTTLSVPPAPASLIKKEKVAPSAIFNITASPLPKPLCIPPIFTTPSSSSIKTTKEAISTTPNIEKKSQMSSSTATKPDENQDMSSDQYYDWLMAAMTDLEEPNLQSEKAVDPSGGISGNQVVKKTSEILKEYNKSLVVEDSNRPATPIADALGKVPFKSVYEEDKGMTPDEYYDWFMAAGNELQENTNNESNK